MRMMLGQIETRPQRLVPLRQAISRDTLRVDAVQDTSSCHGRKGFTWRAARAKLW